MPTYVDGFIVPIPKTKVAAYKAIARKCAKIWLEFGAISYQECIGDDVPVGKRTSFPRSVKLKATETVWFSWIEYPSKRVRDRANKLVMTDPRIAKMMGDIPSIMDGKRMIYGGFKTVITAKRKA